jgi:formylglycine-generating enzyme required for sulfatase activity
MFGKALTRGLLAAAVVASAVSVRAAPIAIATVPVGDAGNAADSAAHSGNPAGQGAVAYNYSIGKYDVTNNQYVAFLTATATSSDPYGLWNDIMQIGYGGINRTGSGPYFYTVTSGRGNQPVVGVSCYDAVRFANWLTDGVTESGTYTITNGGNDSGTVTVPSAAQRAAWAAAGSVHWLLPSEDEWYKAAYYKGGGTNAGYWTYPTRSDTAPTSEVPPGGANSANFFDLTTGFVVTHSTTFVVYTDYLTDVGAYSSSLGPYGTLDQGGDVWQWNEAHINWLQNPSYFPSHGGSFGDAWLSMAASNRSGKALPDN